MTLIFNYPYSSYLKVQVDVALVCSLSPICLEKTLINEKRMSP